MIHPMSSYPPYPPPSAFVTGLREITASGARASIPFAELVALPELEAEVRWPEVVPEDLARAPIVSVPVVDLADPRPHLIGSELLLITGLGLVDDPEWLLGYARAVKEAGTVALGFGIEPVYSEVPPALLDACREVGLPLVAFPAHIPFVHVTTAFFAAMEEERLRRLDRLNRLALGMMHAALSHTPALDIARALAAHLGGLVAFERGDETVEAGSLPSGLPASGLLELASAPRADAEQGPVRAHRFARATLEDGVEVLSAAVASARSRLPAGARLVVAVPRQIGGTDLTAVHLAVDALQVVHSGGATQSAAVDALLMELLSDVLARGDRSSRQRVVRRIASALGVSRERPLIACVARRLDGGPAHASDLAWWRTELSTPFVDLEDRALRAVVARPPSERRLEALRAHGWTVHVSDPVEAQELPEALADGLVLSRRDAARGAGDPSAPRGRWDGLADRQTRAAASKRFLAPLRTFPDVERDDVEAALVCWLEHHGAWDPTARALGLHRNTVRRLIAQAESVLGLPLEDARVRAELLLALDASPRRGSAGSSR